MKILCRLLGHKKLWAMECEPWPNGECALWWCERCEFTEWAKSIKEWFELNKIK